jgi:DNA-directed RNA polymerase specialized sigma subunit
MLSKWADLQRAEKDKFLWDQWNDSGRKPKMFKPLLKEFEPMIMERARVYTGSNINIPPAAINAEFKKQFLRAAETYEPSKGTFGTHAYSTMRAASRFVTTHQNFARIPENRIFNVGDYQRGKAILDANLDREPTHKEMAKFLKWKVGDVVRMNTDLRKDVKASQFDFDVANTGASSVRSALRHATPKLAKKDQLIMKDVLKQKKIHEIAKKFKLSPSAVMRSKIRIGKTLSQYLQDN